MIMFTDKEKDIEIKNFAESLTMTLIDLGVYTSSDIQKDVNKAATVVGMAYDTIDESDALGDHASYRRYVMFAEAIIKIVKANHYTNMGAIIKMARELTENVHGKFPKVGE